MVPVRRVGLYVPGGLAPLVSSVVMNVVPAQVAGVRVDRAGQLAAEGARRPAAPDDPGRLRAARRRRGVRRRRRAGDRDVRLRRRARARAVDLVTGPGNIYTVAAKRLLKGVVGIDSEAGPTEIAILADDTRRRGVRRRRPDQPGRARPAGRGRAGHRLASGWPTTSRPSSTSRSSRTRHTERIRTALGGQQSGIVLVDDLEQGLDVVNAYAAEHLEIQTARRRRAWPPGSATPARSSSARSPRSRSATTAPAPTTCCRPAGCACHSSGLSVRAFRKAVHVVDYTRDALRRGGRPRGHAGRGRGPARATARPSRSGSTAMSRVTFPLLREELRGHRAVRRPAARRPRPAQRQREPLPALARPSSPTSRAPSPRRRATLNRYPDREFAALREALAAYLGPRRHAGAGLGGQRLQRGDAAAAAGLRRAGPHGAVASRRRTRCIPSTPATPTPAGWSATARRTSPSTSTAPVALVASTATARRAAAVAEQPDRHRAAARRRSRRCARRWATGCVVVDEAYAEFRRAGTPSALELLADAPATWWSPAP